MSSFQVNSQFYKMQLLDALAQIEIQEAKWDKKLENVFFKARTMLFESKYRRFRPTL